MGTEDARMLSYDLGDLYEMKVNGHGNFNGNGNLNEDEISEESLRQIMEENELKMSEFEIRE